MRERWVQLCGRIGRGGHPEALHMLLEALYSHPPRAYHTLDHVAACLVLLDEFNPLARARDELEFALWLHDCVYIPGRKDNEEKSAAVAGVFAQDLVCSESTVEHVATLIDATRHTGGPLAGDATLIADIDMAILAAEPREYDLYAAAIRREYAFASDEDYRRGRAAFLRGLLGRRSIYYVPQAIERFESPARGNITREIARLHG